VQNRQIAESPGGESGRCCCEEYLKQWGLNSFEILTKNRFIAVSVTSFRHFGFKNSINGKITLPTSPLTTRSRSNFSLSLIGMMLKWMCRT
jgi:hypothetical protein